jgi:hypothetical protein
MLEVLDKILCSVATITKNVNFIILYVLGEESVKRHIMCFPSVEDWHRV